MVAAAAVTAAVVVVTVVDVVVVEGVEVVRALKNLGYFLSYKVLFLNRFCLEQP